MRSTRLWKMTASVVAAAAVLAPVLLAATESSAGAAPLAGATVAIFTGFGISSPSMIVAGDDGNLWFTNRGTSSIGRLTPTGTVSRFTSPQINHPYAIAQGPYGNIWFTNDGAPDNPANIVVLAFDGSLQWTVSLGIPATALARGPGDSMWFTTTPIVGSRSLIGRASGPLTSTLGADDAKGLTLGPDNAMWYTNAGDNSVRRFDASFSSGPQVFTDAGISAPFGIVTGPEGNLWFTNRGNNSIGRITTAGVVTSFTDATIDDPHEITVGPDGNLWFTNTGGNTIGRITPAGVVTAYPGAGISAPLGIATDAEGNVWFTNSGNDSIGRLTVGRPGAPAWVHANRGDGSATVSWWPAPDNGSPVTGYVLTPIVGGVAQPSSTFDPNTTSAVVTGLANGTAYTFTVRATNALGPGPPSRPSAPITVGTPALPLWVHATRGDGAATVFWWPMGGNGSPVTGYVITPFVAGVAQPPRSAGPDATTAVVTGLTNGTTYTFTVTPFNAFGTGNSSWPTNPVPVGTPAAPIWVYARPANAAASVTWWRLSDNGSPITSFVITPFVGGVAQTPRTFGPGSTSRIVTGLTNGTTYTFTVTAINANGTGASSRPTDPIVVGAPT